ncbi:FtsX-like permease family protein [Streptomyces sp. NPDC000134]|uniref:FtsX-like permease family protein n=1 Tax=Streptomyces sp. NPDC000134 TaxID=3364536 RepID=UPI0036A25222
MLVLALRSVRHRPGRFLATLLSAFLGAAVVMMFTSMHDTAAGDGVDRVSAQTLGTAAGVVGGYGTLLVFFAVASTLTVAVRQRAAELELLRCSGATPGQLGRMVVGEAVAVALAGTVLAVGPAMLGGRALLGVFQDSGQVADGVEYAFGSLALTSGVGITLLAAAGAAFLALRRAGAARTGTGRTRARRFLAYAALVAGAASACSTFALSATDEVLMAPPVYGAILLSVGCALLAPRLLTGVLDRLPLDGASAWLAVRNLRQRAGQLAGVLMSLMLFTAVSTATLTAQAVESDAVAASGRVKSVDAKNLETLNFTVVGIIAVFVCVMLVNSLYAATTYRSREFGQQRLAGATPGQVLGTVGAEGVLLTVTGVFFGTLAALAGVVPFTVVRTDAVLPEQFLGTWAAMAAVGAAVTLGTGLATAHRVLRTPAVGAVARGA